MQRVLSFCVAGVLGFTAFDASAVINNAKVPVCLEKARGKEMQVDNQQVLVWKTTTKNNFHARGYVEGTMKTPIQKQGDHYHFILQIDSGAKDVIEIIYNQEFGSLPQAKVGDRVSACGDYITSYAKSGGYEASPAGALIHWVHFNPATRPTSATHPHGFIVFPNSALAGFDQAPEADWSGDIVKGPEVN